MGIFIEQGWIPQLVISGTTTVLNMYYSEWLEFNIAEGKFINAEAPADGTRYFKHLGDQSTFKLRVHIWKHDNSNWDDYGTSAQAWHDDFIQNFYGVPIHFKTHTGNYNIKGADGATMEFMATKVEYGFLDDPDRSTYLDITIQSLEYIDQTQVSVDVP